jgi:hypothetical protein
MGPGNGAETIAMQSANPQNSEPAPNLPPHFCERIGPTAVVLDCGMRLADCEHTEAPMFKMSTGAAALFVAGLVGLACGGQPGLGLGEGNANGGQAASSTGGIGTPGSGGSGAGGQSSSGIESGASGDQGGSIGSGVGGTGGITSAGGNGCTTDQNTCATDDDCTIGDYRPPILSPADCYCFVCGFPVANTIAVDCQAAYVQFCGPGWNWQEDHNCPAPGCPAFQVRCVAGVCEHFP